MNKTAITRTFLICAVFSLLAVGFQAVILAKGNIWPLSSVTITFPENDKNYHSSTLNMRYHAHFAVDHKWIIYKLDGAEEVTIYDKYGSPYEFDGSVTLSGLTAGSHCLEIYGKNASGTPYSGWFDAGDKIYFNVFISPSVNHISIQSPQNGKNYSEPVLLNFTARYTHFPRDYSYFYTIDDQDVISALESGQAIQNIQFLGTKTITEGDFVYVEYASGGWGHLPSLPQGSHNLTLYSRALYHAVNDYNDVVTVHFNTNPEPTATAEPTSTPEATSQAATFPATLVFVSSVGIALAVIGLFAHFKKHK